MFACGRRQGLKNQLWQKACNRHLAPVEGLYLNKHLHWKSIPDVFVLKKIVAAQDIDIIHSHQDNDALTAVLAGFGKGLVRTWYDGEVRPLNYRQRLIFRKTAKIITASRQVCGYLSRQYPGKDIEQVDIPVDIDRFRPLPKNERLLKEFGITPRNPVAGIVARVQKHRNFPLLLEAIEQVVREIQDLKFLIVGRGTHLDTVAGQPVKIRGLEKNVIFAGYRKDDYREVLNLFDCKVFLTPGSDGSCRAVREALACGKPVIAARRGILAELIEDGETGMLIDDRTSDLVRAMTILLKDNEFRLNCSRAARQYAETILDPQKYVKKVVGCYASLCDRS
jgi:glycosyltransferase involved in cell wall biosynthesis